MEWVEFLNMISQQLDSNEDFKFLADYKFRSIGINISNQKGAVNNFYSSRDFVKTFECIDTLPKLAGSWNKLDADRYVKSIVNYAIGFLFTAAYLDMFITKYHGDITDCQEKFERYAITVIENNVCRDGGIIFYMVDRRVPDYIEIKVSIPEYSLNAYGDLNNIQDFLDLSKCFVIDIVAPSRPRVGMHVLHKMDTLDKFPSILKETIKSYKINCLYKQV